MKSPATRTAPTALDLLERAVHLLRGAPAGVWAAYAIGTLPFALGLLYFWGEMSSSAFARHHCAPESLALGGLFVWMKCWQSVFCRRLHGHLIGAAPARWSASAIFNLIALQGVAQSCGLFILPLALLLLAPFGWLYAYAQTLTTLGQDKAGAGAALRKGWFLAALWPGGNFLMLLILSLFGLFVWLNVILAMYFVPQLLKMLLGIETIFTLSGWTVYLNTTVLLASFVTAYFCVDPLSKAAYVLRCFHGLSLASGEDLRVELAACRRAAALAVAGLFLTHAAAAGAETPPPQTPISAPQLNRSIEEVLKRDEFTWRMPREAESDQDAKQSWFSRFIEDSAQAVKGAMHWIGKAVRAVWDWLEKIFTRSSPDGSESGASSGFAWMFLLQILAVILIVAICCVIAVIFLREWKQRQRIQVVVAEAAAAAPDLQDENVVASQLPEDAWLRLAVEMMDKGDFRLALRAYYLACLAHLSQRQMIAIAKFKSNRDYETELRRRARARPELHRAFSDNGAIFDRTWYGLHQVTQEAVSEFQANLERIRAC